MKTKTWFGKLGVQIQDGHVNTFALGKGKPLGPLNGAHAEVSEAGNIKYGAAVAHTLLAGPAGIYLGRRSSYAYIAFPDGTIHKHEIRGKAEWRQAQQEALEFNLLAQA